MRRILAPLPIGKWQNASLKNHIFLKLDLDTVFGRFTGRMRRILAPPPIGKWQNASLKIPEPIWNETRQLTGVNLKLRTLQGDSGTVRDRSSNLYARFRTDHGGPTEVARFCREPPLRSGNAPKEHCFPVLIQRVVLNLSRLILVTQVATGELPAWQDKETERISCENSWSDARRISSGFSITLPFG